MKKVRQGSTFQLLKIPATYFALGVRGFRKSGNRKKKKKVFFFSCEATQKYVTEIVKSFFHPLLLDLIKTLIMVSVL